MIKKRTNNLDQMKKNWVQNGPARTEEERIVRRFNQVGQSAKGRIKMDKDTYVIYDYSKEFPVSRLETNNKHEKIPNQHGVVGELNDFKMPKFPVLTLISNGPPDVSAGSADEMDLVLNKSMNNAFLWKNGDFVYF